MSAVEGERSYAGGLLRLAGGNDLAVRGRRRERAGLLACAGREREWARIGPGRGRDFAPFCFSFVVFY